MYVHTGLHLLHPRRMGWALLLQIAFVFATIRLLVYTFLSVTDYSGLRCSLYLLFDDFPRGLGPFMYSMIRLPFVWAGLAKRRNCDQQYAEVVTQRELQESLELTEDDYKAIDTGIAPLDWLGNTIFGDGCPDGYDEQGDGSACRKEEQPNAGSTCALWGNPGVTHCSQVACPPGWDVTGDGSACDGPGDRVCALRGNAGLERCKNVWKEFKD